MRTSSSVSLAIVATVVGLCGSLQLAASGLTLAGPGLTVIEYSDSDDAERTIGIGMGVFALATWVALLSVALVGVRGGGRVPARRGAILVVVGLSLLLVLGALLAVLAVQPPTSH